MHLWLNILNLLFWFGIVCMVFNANNFIHLVFIGELVWLILYAISIYTGMINDDPSLLVLTFFILGFASLEFSIGFLLIISFKHFGYSTSVDNSVGINNIDSNNTKTWIFFDRFFWN